MGKLLCRDGMLRLAANVRERPEQWLSRLIFLLGPWVSFWMVEILNGNDVFSDLYSWQVLMNLIWYYLLFLLCRLILGRRRRAAAAAWVRLRRRPGFWLCCAVQRRLPWAEVLRAGTVRQRGEHDDTSACIAKNSRNGGWIRLFCCGACCGVCALFHHCGHSRNDADTAAEDCPDG